MAAQGWSICLAVLLLAMLGAPTDASLVPGTDASLVHGFYWGKCPNKFTNVEAIVRHAIKRAVYKDPTLPAGLTRIHFHDSFVKGADASLLIDTPTSERTSPINAAMHGFDVIDAVKAEVEKQCPGVVSCADILTFATRDSIYFSKGPYIRVRSGRRDGLDSQAKNVPGQLPGPFQNVTAITANFASKGLTQRDVVVLSGAHTIGRARCRTFQNRLFTFSSTSPTDPNLNPDLASQLKKQCPAGQNLDTGIPMDSFTPTKFDNAYYIGLLQGKGIFTSDDDLVRNPNTFPLVRSFASWRGGRRWRSREFPASWTKLSEVGVLTGTDGEIRKICSKFNSA